MIHLSLALVGLMSSFVFALALGGGWLRQIALVPAGVAVLGVATVYSLATDCAGCTPEIGPSLAAFALAGWLAGIGIAALARRRSPRRPGGRMIAAAGLLFVLVAGVVGSGRYALEIVRWGCPSQAELERLQSMQDVLIAFARRDMPLERIRLPVWLPPSEPAYRGAHAFRHAAGGATVYVLVCRQRCAISRFKFGEAREVGEQRWRLGLGSNNNVPVWVTEADRRAGRRMLAAIAPALRDVHPYIDSDSRCYVR